MRTITIQELAEKGLKEGEVAYLSTWMGPLRIGYIRGWPNDPWAVCPDANAGFGLSFMVSRWQHITVEEAS